MRRALAVFVSAVSLLLPAACVIPKPPPVIPGPDYSGAASAHTCPAHILYGVRGSGEPRGGTDRGLGPAINEVLNEMGRDFGTANVGAAANAYPAAAFTFALGSKTLPAQAADYGTSVLQGAAAMARDIRALRIRCGHSLITVAGYSQGADVVRRGLALLGSPTSDASKNQVILFGDPNFQAREPNVSEDGDFSLTRNGIARSLLAFTHLPVVPAIPRGYRVYSYCHSNDLVCQLGATSTAGHENYQTTSADVAAWSTDAAPLAPRTAVLKTPIESGFAGIQCPTNANNSGSVAYQISLNVPISGSPTYDTKITIKDFSRVVATSTISPEAIVAGVYHLPDANPHLISVNGLGHVLASHYEERGLCTVPPDFARIGAPTSSK